MNANTDAGWHDTVALLPVSSLLPTEEFNEDRAKEVHKMVISANFWTQKIAVHESSYVVMDGHHRLAVAKRLGLKYVPCALLSYDKVKVETRRPEVAVSPDEIVRRGKEGRLYPEKTTKHHFPEVDLCCEVPLHVLMGN